MPRFVVLRFDDNDGAEVFCNWVKQNEPEKWLDIVGQPKADLVGLYAIPTRFCECPPYDDDGPGKRGNGRAVACGEKFGWWVHRKCGLAIEGSYQSPRNLLLPKAETLREKFKSPQARPLWVFSPSAKDSP